MPQIFTDSAGNGGAQGTPTPETSQQPGQQNSQNAEASEWVKLSKRLEALERGMQSDKDRAVAKVAKELEGYKPVLDKVSRMLNLSEEQVKAAERELEYDAMKAKVFGEPQGNSQPGKQAESQIDTVSEVAKSLGLNLDDPDVVNITRNAQGLEAIKQFTALAVKRAQAPAPNAALNAAPVNGASAPSDGQLRNDYVKEMRAAAGKGFDVGMEIKKRYLEKGLNVHEIDLTRI